MSSPDSQRAPALARAALLPLVVDMDGTLLATDVLAEGIVAGFFSKPVSTLLAVPQLLGGRARFKRRIAELDAADIDAAPLRADVVDWLRDEKDKGRAIHLVSAADEAIARRVADRVGVFDTVQGSRDGLNLKSRRKAAALTQRFPLGYVYAGDSRADLAVWREAAGIVTVGVSAGVKRRVERMAAPVERAFVTPKAGPETWCSALRLRQWSKNLLVFVPLMLSGEFRHPDAILASVLAFLLVSIASSGTYLLNDLVDLGPDRRHRSKHCRPLAAGLIPIHTGAIAALCLIVGAMLAAQLALPAMGPPLAAYLLLTCSYSLRYKRVAFLDAFLLAGLYTLRLIIGATVVGKPGSAWLLSFAMLFFFAMSLAKRHVEIASAPAGPIPGRGYQGQDGPLTLAFGVSAAIGSVMILIIYLMEEAFPSGLFSNPVWLWAAPVLLALWSMRIGLLAHRGALDAGPLSFAVADPLSLAMGALLAAAFALAMFSG